MHVPVKDQEQENYITNETSCFQKKGNQDKLKFMVKKALPWVLFAAMIGLLIAIFVLKSNMNNHLSKMMKSQVSSELASALELRVDSLFNYSRNGLAFKVTLIEFGAQSWAVCRRIEAVLDEIRNKYPETVNVVSMNVSNRESLNLLNYFGIATIPSQLLLDQNGVEFFRHSGYYSSEELIKEFDKYLITKNL